MQALIRAELNSAKGALYDELRVKAERSEAECQRLLVVEATFKRLVQASRRCGARGDGIRDCTVGAVRTQGDCGSQA